MRGSNKDFFSKYFRAQQMGGNEIGTLWVATYIKLDIAGGRQLGMF